MRRGLGLVGVLLGRSRARLLAAVAVSAAMSLVVCGSAVAGPQPLGSISEFSTGLNPGGYPDNVTPGADGNVWFTDTGVTKAIGRIAPNGTINEFSTGLNPGSAVQGIAVGADGNVWFTDHGATPAIGRITPNGTIKEFSTGLNAGSIPALIGAGADGNMWFTDQGTTPAIGRITPDGTIKEFSTGLNPGSAPYGIAAGADGNMWFTDYGSRAIGRVTPNGTINEFSTGLNVGSDPTGLAAGADGNLWFDDGGTTKAIGRIAPDGTITEFSPGLNPGSNPAGIAAGADGSMWFTDVGMTKAIGRIASNGTITEFSSGLNPGSIPYGIAAGADGNVWFTDLGGALGRVGVGAAVGSLVAPSVTGSGQQGTQQVCQGDRWNNWAGQQPSVNAFSFDGYQWLRDGATIAGAIGQIYTPATGDVGHALSCTVTVTYPLLNVTTSSTSARVTVIAQSSGPQGLPGQRGLTGPQGPAGKIELVVCTVQKNHKKKCTTKLVSRVVKFTSTAGDVGASISRAGVIYATGLGIPTGHGHWQLVVTHRIRTLRSGRYTLTLRTLQGHRRIVQSTTIDIG
jgi:virginiamycin B lyase